MLGPAATFIAGSNEIAFAIIIILPLLWYIWHITERRWLKLGLVGAQDSACSRCSDPNPGVRCWP